MGFSLELFFEELFASLNKDQKARKTLADIQRDVLEQYNYAKKCGTISKDHKLP